MNLDERIEKVFDIMAGADRPFGITAWSDAKETNKQLIRDVLEEVKPRKKDYPNWDKYSIERQLGISFALDDMEAKIKEIGL